MSFRARLNNPLYFLGEPTTPLGLSGEPTYAVIYNGAWLDDRPYHVIHRVASLPHYHGVMKDLLDWSFSKDDNIRIDTHKDNTIMQQCLTKYGFTYCDIIHLQNGDERLAYQKLAVL